MPSPLSALTALLFLPIFAPAVSASAADTARPEPACVFDVMANGPPRQLQLAITARCRPEIERIEFARTDRLAVGNVRTLSGAPATATARGWQTGGGGLTYDVDLASRVGGGRGSRDVALTADTLMAPLDTWLGMPEPTRFDADLHVRIKTSPGLHAIHAMQPLGPSAPQISRLTAGGLSFAGYSLFSTRPALQVEVTGRDGEPVPIAVHVGASDIAIGAPALASWVQYFAALSAEYWQGFPVDRLMVAIVPAGAADRVSFGRVRGGGGATMQIVAGRGVTANTLYRRDWILTHELLHLAQPHLPRDGMWLMEGMATYVEPILRHIAGLYTADQVWSEWLGGMPAGSLGLTTMGLQRTNPYWGGALALLATNIAIVEATDGNKTMVDCLRAGLRSVGNATVRAQTSAIISACDQSVGFPAMADFVSWHRSATEFNLPRLWQKLGVSKNGSSVAYADNAAAKVLRAAMLAPPDGFKAPPLPPDLLPLN